MKNYLELISSRVSLTKEQAQDVFTSMVEGLLDPIEIAALLIALKTKGETMAEISGAATALRKAASPFPRPDFDIADSCGTGGDNTHTINVSTASALICAAMGIPMVKHGNRSISSKCGSADVLEQLGVKIDCTAIVARKCLDLASICFLFAPLYHSGLRHAGPVRKQLAIRTIMNVLGPLVNPALPTHQVMGVYDPQLCPVIAEVLGNLGCKKALVVHGSLMDEIAVHGSTNAALYCNGSVEEFIIRPEDAGLDTFSLNEIKGGTPEENMFFLKTLLQGKAKKAHNAAVAINAGAMAWVFGKAKDLKEGTQMAQETIGAGSGFKVLKNLQELSNDS